MKTEQLFIYVLLLVTVCVCGSSSASETTETIRPVPLADPFILLHDDVYYAYGTHAENGIEVYVSTDLKTWSFRDLALKKENSYGDRWFWAPEVYDVNGTFYMYYSADEHICVATSDSPTGPFVQKEKKPMLEGEKSIDNSLFIDADGTPYLFFVRFNDGNNIWVAELEEDLMTLKPETMHHCMSVSQPWEEVWPRVNEGPIITKHNGTYYMTYSANSYESPMYGIGIATADHIMGEWKKYEDNPALQSPGSLLGVGHNSIFRDKEGKLRIVFHAHYNSSSIHPRCMYVTTASFTEEGRMIINPDYTQCILNQESITDKFK